VAFTKQHTTHSMLLSAKAAWRPWLVTGSSGDQATTAASWPAAAQQQLQQPPPRAAPPTDPTCSCLSVPLRPRLVTISRSFLATISYVISLASIVSSLSRFLAATPGNRHQSEGQWHKGRC